MNKTVRIGTIKDQDRCRRDDLRTMSPDQRVELLRLQREQLYGDRAHRLERVARVVRIGQ